MAKRHPIVFSLLTVIIFQLSINLAGIYLSLIAPNILEHGEFTFQAIAEGFAAFIAVGTAYLFGCFGIFKEKGIGFGRGLGVSAYMWVMAIMAFVSQFALLLTDGQQHKLASPIAILGYFACMLLVGFVEEVFFRGVIANLFFDKYAKTPAGIWTATIGAGLIFGLMHIVNLIGADPVGVLVQVVAVTGMGVMLTAVYFRCRNIWVLVFVHAFNNICAAIMQGLFEGGSLSEEIASYSPEQLVSVLPYIVVTLILLRPSKLKEILRRRFPEVLEAPKSEPADKLRLVISVLLAVIAVSALVGAIFILYYL